VIASGLLTSKAKSNLMIAKTTHNVSFHSSKFVPFNVLIEDKCEEKKGYPRLTKYEIFKLTKIAYVNRLYAN
jgi:hypothetical protein